MFAVYHEDKFTRYLLKVVDSYQEAEEYVHQYYGDKLTTDTHRKLPATKRLPERMQPLDKVVVVGDDNRDLGTYYVEWSMPQFEALKSWTFTSDSNPRVKYETRLTKTGIISCNCRGWTFKKPGKARWCKHTTDVIQTEGLTVREVGQYLVVEDKKLTAAKRKYGDATVTVQQKFLEMVADYESLLQQMGQLDPSDNKIWDLFPKIEVAKFKVESYMVMLDANDTEAMAKFEAVKGTAAALGH